MKPNSPLPAAVVFDMDGVLIDSNPFHLEKWVDFLKRHSFAYEPDGLPKLNLGQRNDTILRHFFGQDLSKEQSRQYGDELEATFRGAFEAHAKPLPGLEDLMMQCQRADIPMAVASSAMLKNVDFAVDALGFRKYFTYIVSGDEVSQPKPHPEIYLKAARHLDFQPADCVAFEDSFVGIESAKAAGMKCVAVASTFLIGELRTQSQADLAVPSFMEISLEKLRELFLESK